MLDVLIRAEACNTKRVVFAKQAFIDGSWNFIDAASLAPELHGLGAEFGFPLAIFPLRLLEAELFEHPLPPITTTHGTGHCGLRRDLMFDPYLHTVEVEVIATLNLTVSQ